MAGSGPKCKAELGSFCENRGLFDAYRFRPGKRKVAFGGPSLSDRRCSGDAERQPGIFLAAIGQKADACEAQDHHAPSGGFRYSRNIIELDV
jgi:hypothetical protein